MALGQASPCFPCSWGVAPVYGEKGCWPSNQKTQLQNSRRGLGSSQVRGLKQASMEPRDPQSAMASRVPPESPPFIRPFKRFSHYDRTQNRGGPASRVDVAECVSQKDMRNTLPQGRNIELAPCGNKLAPSNTPLAPCDSSFLPCDTPLAPCGRPFLPCNFSLAPSNFPSAHSTRPSAQSQLAILPQTPQAQPLPLGERLVARRAGNVSPLIQPHPLHLHKTLPETLAIGRSLLCRPPTLWPVSDRATPG